MARPRTIPDAVIHAAIRQLLAAGGDKAVAFGAVARAAGLAAPTLVQRYGSRDGMVRAALLDAWDRLDPLTEEARSTAPMTAKGAAILLKQLGTDAHAVTRLAVDFRDAVVRARALAWRDRVEEALAARLGGGTKGREAASVLFAAWQGQMLWQMAGDKGFRLKDAVRRLA